MKEMSIILWIHKKFTESYRPSELIFTWLPVHYRSYIGTPFSNSRVSWHGMMGIPILRNFNSHFEDLTCNTDEYMQTKLLLEVFNYWAHVWFTQLNDKHDNKHIETEWMKLHHLDACPFETANNYNRETNTPLHFDNCLTCCTSSWGSLWRKQPVVVRYYVPV